MEIMKLTLRFTPLPHPSVSPLLGMESLFPTDRKAPTVKKKRLFSMKKIDRPND